MRTRELQWDSLRDPPAGEQLFGIQYRNTEILYEGIGALMLVFRYFPARCHSDDQNPGYLVKVNFG